MADVTLSPKYQVVIPLAIRRALGLKPGEKLRIIRHGARIELIPVRRMKSLRGFLGGLNTTIDREADRL